MEDAEIKVQIESLHTIIAEMGAKFNEIIPKSTVALDRYKTLIREKGSYLNELISLEAKEKGLIETTHAIESAELVSITNEKDEETKKPVFSNETARQTELFSRKSKNPDYQKAKTQLEEVQYKKKNLLNTQSMNRSWRKYYELEILSETHR